jgi:hypothetical protein
MAPRAAETETGVFALDRAKRPTKGKRCALWRALLTLWWCLAVP